MIVYVLFVIRILLSVTILAQAILAQALVRYHRLFVVSSRFAAI